MKRPILYWCAVLLVAMPCACNDAKQPDVDQSIAKAVHVEDPQKEAREKLEAKARAERQERAAQQKEKETARAAEIDAAAVLPDVVPTSLEEACDATVNAYDTFMKNGPEKDALLWFEGRRKKMAERRAACVTQANTAVAACQAQALVAPLPTLLELERTEAANLVFQRCADKFGKT
jgi:hypothetical protein